jgi:hypothetical protein
MSQEDAAKERARKGGYVVTPSLGETAPESGQGAEAVATSSLIKAGLRGSRDDYEYSLSTFHKSPCFRQALMWGIGLGLAVAAHRFKETSESSRVRVTRIRGCSADWQATREACAGAAIKAVDGFVVSWAGVSMGAW